jgi:SAM-dependent methyltransferase
MQVLLRAAFHLSRLRAHDTVRVAIVVDADTGIDVNVVAAFLMPWRSWLEPTSVLVTDVSPPDDWFDTAAANTHAISIITESPEFGAPIENAAVTRGLVIARSDYNTTSERQAALLHEMSHHHFEIGGVNEWDGSPVQYAPNVLQHLSAANCKIYFPHYAIDEVQQNYMEKQQPIEALDIGSGPISRLRWGALKGLLHITGVDPLLDVYDVLLAHHGLDRLPAIRVERAITAGAEDLNAHVVPASFDFAFCCNVLDHVEDPSTVIEEIARALRPNACLALEFATREGSRQKWQQLHQFDLFLSDDHSELMCQSRDGSTNRLVAKGTGLSLDRVVVATDDYTAVLLRRASRSSCWPSRGGGMRA